MSIISFRWQTRRRPRVIIIFHSSNDRLLQTVIQVYRGERWYELLEEALFLGLECAKQLDDETNVFRFSLELLSDGSPTDS